MRAVCSTTVNAPVPSVLCATLTRPSPGSVNLPTFLGACALAPNSGDCGHGMQTGATTPAKVSRGNDR